MSENAPKVFGQFVFLGWNACITTPMWLMLFYQLLAAVDAPPWVWALYFCYLPAHAVGLILGIIVHLLED